MKKIFDIFCLLLCSWLISCDATVHEYPTSGHVKLIVEAYTDLAMPELYYEYVCDAKAGNQLLVRSGDGSGSRVFDENVQLRFNFDLRRSINSSTSQSVGKVVQFAAPDAERPQAVAEFEPTPGVYKALIWCDYVSDQMGNDWYYKVSDLRTIVYTDVVPEDNDDKDAYTGVETVDLTPYINAGEGHTVTVPVNLNRPLGRWRLVADDIADFEAAGGNVSALWTRATYISFVSSGYNVESQEPNLFDEPQSRTFFHPIYDRSSGEMTHDYIFVYGKESYVSLYLEFYEGDRKISSWNVPDVPLMRNRETLIHGRFLTSASQSGGIGIDPGFNGEHIVPVKRDDVPANGVSNK